MIPNKKNHIADSFSMAYKFLFKSNAPTNSIDWSKSRKICNICISKERVPVVPHFSVPAPYCYDHYVVETILTLFVLIYCATVCFSVHHFGWWLPNYNLSDVIPRTTDPFIFMFIIFGCSRTLLCSFAYNVYLFFGEFLKNNIGLLVCFRYGSAILWIMYVLFMTHVVLCLNGPQVTFVSIMPNFLYVVLYQEYIEDFFNRNLFSLPIEFIDIGNFEHCCARSATEARKEAELWINDYNLKMRHILFNSFGNALYGALLPCCYASDNIILEWHIFLVYSLTIFCTCIILYLSLYFPFEYYELCHQAAVHLGTWKEISGPGKDRICYQWDSKVFWYKNLIVKHKQKYYKAECFVNSAEPGNIHHEVFYRCFSDVIKSFNYGMMCKASAMFILFFTILFILYPEQGIPLLIPLIIVARSFAESLNVLCVKRLIYVKEYNFYKRLVNA